MMAIGSELWDDAGICLGKFSSHWAACAAMIRMSDPEFRSLGTDRIDDLALEMRIRKERA